MIYHERPELQPGAITPVSGFVHVLVDDPSLFNVIVKYDSVSVRSGVASTS